MRFFRISDTSVYESTRLGLDAAWGLPDGKGTVTCVEPAATAPRDSEGQIVLAVADEFCAFSVAVDLLPQLLASGAVEEITEADYQAALTPPLTP